MSLTSNRYVCLPPSFRLFYLNKSVCRTHKPYPIFFTQITHSVGEGVKGKMEKAMVKVGSIKAKAGSYWISKKAKQEFSNISDDLNTFSNTVEEKAKWIFNKLKGKPVKSLPELLREYNLPPGLFPNNMICYEFDETKAKLVVYLPSACEVTFKDSSVVRYATRVKGILLRGKLTGIEGMKTKVLVWVKVTNVAVEGYRSDKVWFTAGVKRSRPGDAYEMPRDAIRVEEF